MPGLKDNNKVITESQITKTLVKFLKDFFSLLFHGIIAITYFTILNISAAIFSFCVATSEHRGIQVIFLTWKDIKQGNHLFPRAFQMSYMLLVLLQLECVCQLQLVMSDTDHYVLFPKVFCSYGATLFSEISKQTAGTRVWQPSLFLWGAVEHSVWV